MAPPPPPSPASRPGSRGHARRASRADRSTRRRRRVRTGALVGGAVALVVVGGIVAAVAVGSDGDSSPAATVRPAPTTRAPLPAPDPGWCDRPLTPDDPLRLWIAGDSLAGSLGPALGEATAATGVVQPVFDSRVSSGLSSPGFFDWPEHATEELARLDPEVVVFVIGANDWTAPLDRTEGPDGRPAWRADYTERVEQMLDVLTGEGRHVYWVGAPIMKDPRRAEGAADVNAVARDAVARRDDATYVDAHTLFGPDGEYTPTLEVDGRDVRMRAGDGVHLTVAGGELLGRSVLAPLDAECRLTEQAVPGIRKRVIETQGSTRVTGGSGSSGSSRTSGTTTAETVPSSPDAAPAPTTAAPTTATTTAPTTASTTAPTTATTTAPTSDTSTSPGGGHGNGKGPSG